MTDPLKDQGPDNISIPQGEWVDVPRGFVMAEATYVDAHGILRSSGDHSVVAWHNKGCERRGLRVKDLVFGENGAQHCPDCWAVNEEKRRIAALFGPTQDQVQVQPDPFELTDKDFNDF